MELAELAFTVLDCISGLLFPLKIATSTVNHGLNSYLKLERKRRCR